MRMLLCGFLMLTLATEGRSADGGNPFVSNDYGISIDAPGSKGIATSNDQIAAFFLPPSDNFAANVNILRQQFNDSLEAYDKSSLAQFKQFKLTVLNRALKGNEIRYEYKGDMGGRMLHWYARTVKTGPYVYLVTATGLDSQWEQQKSVLIKSVESFAAKR